MGRRGGGYAEGMTIPEPTGQPDIERPVDLTDTPDRDDQAAPAPVPEHHPDDPGPPGDVA
jgi:hypothetical protein